MATLTRELAEALGRAIRPKLGYLVRLRERMDRAAFSHDPLYPLVRSAEEALHRLSVALHYRSREHGTGQPPGT